MIAEYLKAYILYPVLEKTLLRRILVKLEIIKKYGKISLPVRLVLRKKKLADVLRMAKENVPYYRELFRKLNFDPGKVEKDTSYLNELPYLDKNIIIEQGPRLLNKKYTRDSLHIRKTGGSTGPSTLIYYSQSALDWTAAANLLVFEWAGKKRHMREAQLSNRQPNLEPWENRLKERLKCLAMNRTNILTDIFDKDSLAKIWERLKKAKPYLIQGHPSTLYALALFLKGNNETAEGILKVFESTGEVLDKKKRETIEDAFSCEVFDRYGNAEFGVVSHELKDPKGKQKVLDFITWPEILNLENGINEIVLTGLTNDAMPLIRYRTGDLGKLEVCEDGFYLKDIQGRVHDIVKIGDKNYPTHYIQDLLDKIGGVAEFQLELKDSLLPLLRIALSDANAKGAITERINALWLGKIVLEFTDFAGLKRVGWREKFRYVVQ